MGKDIAKSIFVENPCQSLQFDSCCVEYHHFRIIYFKYIKDSCQLKTHLQLIEFIVKYEHKNVKKYYIILNNWTTNVRLIFGCISRWCCLFVIHFVVWFEMALHSVNKEVDLKSVCFCRASNFYKFLECMYQYRDYLLILDINNSARW